MKCVFVLVCVLGGGGGGGHACVFCHWMRLHRAARAHKALFSKQRRDVLSVRKVLGSRAELLLLCVFFP